MLIAQISDTHLRGDGTPMHDNINPAETLADCIAHINRLHPRPDVVLATGDLVDRGLSDDYAVLRPILDRLQMPVYVIPGNHDDRTAMRDAFGERDYLPNDRAFLQYTIEHYPLRLIGLDTLLAGKVHGGLCQDRRRWLVERLAEQQEKPTVVFMHHPPFASGIHFLDEPVFEGAQEVSEIIRAHPQVRQVLCGHIHRAIHLNWAGTCAAVAPSTVYQMNLAFDPTRTFDPSNDPPAISLYRWHDGLGPVGYTSLIGRQQAVRDRADLSAASPLSSAHPPQ
jgi:3',5'-cyclic-AMP phosphodiesterase